jgi:TolA-binding protein
MKTCIALLIVCSLAAAQDPVAWLPPAESAEAPSPVSLADLEKLERRYREQLDTQQKALDDVTREIQRLKSEKTSLEDYKKIQESKETRQVEFNWTKISERIDKAAAYYDLSWQFTESSGSVLECSRPSMPSPRRNPPSPPTASTRPWISLKMKPAAANGWRSPVSSARAPSISSNLTSA